MAPPMNPSREEMLAATFNPKIAKQGAKALHFAEAGLAKAREKNDRDSEQYFLELVQAAKKMTG